MRSGELGGVLRVLGCSTGRRQTGGGHLGLRSACSTYGSVRQPDQRLEALGKLAGEGEFDRCRLRWKPRYGGGRNTVVAQRQFTEIEWESAFEKTALITFSS